MVGSKYVCHRQKTEMGNTREIVERFRDGIEDINSGYKRESNGNRNIRDGINSLRW